MTVTPEEIYQEWHKQTLLNTKGIYPRSVQNFTNIKQSDKWVYFKKLADIVNNGNGVLDYKIYIKSLCSFYPEQGIHPSILINQKGFKIYRNFININNTHTDINEIKKNVLENINFIINYCKENKINKFYDYINDNNLIPRLIMHFNSGNVSIYFLSLIDNFELIIKEYPTDVIQDFFGDLTEFFNKIKQYRLKLTQDENLRKINNNLEKIINNKLGEINK